MGFFLWSSRNPGAYLRRGPPNIQMYVKRGSRPSLMPSVGMEGRLEVMETDGLVLQMRTWSSRVVNSWDLDLVPRNSAGQR